MSAKTALLLRQLLNSPDPTPISARPLRVVPPPPLLRSDDLGVEWILSLRSEQMATLASEGLSLREICQRFGITRDGVKSGLWRASHANRPESSNRISHTASSGPPTVGSLYEANRRLLTSGAEPPSLTHFIAQSPYPQPFFGAEQEGLR